MKRFVVTVAPLAIFTIGFWDDLKPLGARTKLMGQVLIAVAVTQSGVGIAGLKIPACEGIIGAGAWDAILTVGWLVTCTNVTNLVDGVDGLAGSIGLILMGLLLYLSQGTLVCLTAGMTGALLAFLCYNLPPARIYLGDGGAYFIGFQVGLFSILASQTSSDPAPLVLPLFGLALPLLDTALAVARRVLRGLPVFRPDRNHLHHYLLESGMSSRRVLLWYAMFTLLFLLAGTATIFWPRVRLVPVPLGLGLGLVLVSWKLKLNFSGWQTLTRRMNACLAMRREIAYALCLRSWLKHEAERCASVEELYADLRLSARRLGFTSVRLALADGYRMWKQPSVCGPSVSTCHSLQGGTLGVLELEAPRCRFSSRESALRDGSPARCGRVCRPLLNEPRLINMLSELLAESWVEATRDWNPGKVRLRFDHKLPQIWGVARRGIESNPAQLSCADFKERDLHATRTPGFLKRACGFAVCAVLLNVPDGMGRELPASVVPQESLTNIPRVELPATAARLVQSAKSSECRAVVGAVIQSAIKVSPAVVPAVVGAISKTVPEMAAVAAGEAAREQPARAFAIAKAAAGAAPAHTKAIVLAVCWAVPGEHKRVALSVEQVVPGSSQQILEALALLSPEMLNAITNFPSAVARPSVSAVFESTSGRTSPRLELVRSGVRTVAGDPLVRGPAVGPPFVPLSGTVTNVTPSTSGTVPTGGRNYATP